MKIVILTGAGISAESGLGTFRDTGGIWSQYDLSEVATPKGFARNPGLVHDFYNLRRANARAAAPNPAHEALTRLQRESGDDVVIVTQNIDDLHERAGARGVIHMHGEVLRGLCARCGATWKIDGDLSPETPCPECTARATRPDVVWFGEMPYHMDTIAAHLASAHVFVAIGTSGTVYPAAGFVAEARAAGAETLELNLERSGISRAFDETRLGPASEIVPAWVAQVLGD